MVDALILIGFALVVAGVGMLSVPAAAITAGACLIFAAVSIAVRRRGIATRKLREVVLARAKGIQEPSP